MHASLRARLPPAGDVSLFLTVEGHASREILLQANNLHQAVQAYTLADGAPVEMQSSMIDG